MYHGKSTKPLRPAFCEVLSVLTADLNLFFRISDSSGSTTAATKASVFFERFFLRHRETPPKTATIAIQS